MPDHEQEAPAEETTPPPAPPTTIEAWRAANAAMISADVLERIKALANKQGK